uniref:RING-type domain-containing protein n=1 Tax=Echeneis naucrates TaxID=173247 RepID=A0A665VH89_ECHNA
MSDLVSILIQANMASAAPSSMEEHLTCCICWNTFEDPVTTDCGHSFCKKCLESSSKCGRGSCPICKKPLNDHISWPENSPGEDGMHPQRAEVRAARLADTAGSEN